MKNKLLYKVNKGIEQHQNYKEQICSWFLSDEIKELVDVFQGEFPKNKSEQEILSWLVRFSEIWDYRNNQKSTLDTATGEKARWLVSNAGLSEKQKECIDKVIKKLGLLGVSKPSLERYDYILALGGARMSCMYRTKYAWQMAQKYNEALKALILLGAMRPVAESERKATDTYAKGAVTEFDLMEAAIYRCGKEIKRTGEVFENNENNNLSWKMNSYMECENNIPVIAMAAPSTDPMRRANSADSYKFFIEKIAEKKRSSLLLVTSQIYVPYQHIEAVRTLGLVHGVTIDTIGFPVEWNVNVSGGMMQYENYLQEIRSALQAIERLWKVIG